ncbi:MAG: DUF4097 family beta strand repeat-containing protein [Bacteroidota bacterium]
MKIIAYIVMYSVMLLSAEVKSIKKTIPVKDAQAVELMGFSGASLTIKSWDKNEIAIDIKVDYSSSNKENEQEYVQSVDVTQEQTGERVIVSFRQSKRGDEGFSWKKLFSLQFFTYSNLKVTGEIYVPASHPLIADFRYGDYSLEGIQGSLELYGVSNTLFIKNCSAIKKIENNYGKTTIEQSGGGLSLEGTSSTISIRNFTGQVDADASYSTITLNSIKQNATVLCVSGHIEMNDIGGNVILDAKYSKMRLEKVRGTTSIESQSGTIQMKEIFGADIDAPYSNISIESVNGTGNPISVRNMSGDVTIYNCSRDVKIEDSYSKIELENIQGNIKIAGQSSSIDGKRITGNVIIKDEYADIQIDQLSASTVEITNKSNKIDIDLLTKPAKIEIFNEYGPVSVRLPDFIGDVKLKASYGSVITNLPVEVEEIGGGFIAMGKIGNGSGTMNIKTVSGNIEVHQKK